MNKTMSERYVNISGDNFFKFLGDKGFTKSTSNDEVIYERAHHLCKNLKIVVYTSIDVNSNQPRNNGKDAIRVIAFYRNGDKSFGVAGRKSVSRVYRTGSEEKVFERTLERMRSAYGICNDWLKQNSWAKT